MIIIVVAMNLQSLSEQGAQLPQRDHATRSCYVSRGMGARTVSNSKSDN